MKTVKVLGLDLDGTLVRMKLDFKKIRKELGIPQGDTLAYISALPHKEANRLRSILARREKEAAEEAELSPGAAEILDYCRKMDIKVVVITRNSSESAERTLAVLGIEVDLIISRDSAEPKPSPESLNLVLNHFKVKPHEMAYIGDYLYDIQAGNSAGVKTILITRQDQAGRWESLADYVVTDLYEVLDLIRESKKIR